MRTWTASKVADDPREFLAKERFAADSDYDTLVEAPFQLSDTDGNVLVTAVEAPGSADLKRACRKLNYGIADRSAGMRGYSRTFGAMPRRTLRADYCSRSLLDTQEPEVYETLIKYGKRAASTVEQHWPAAYERTSAYVSQVATPWKLPCGLFTSGIINKTTALRYHKDRGNWPDNVSAMYVFTRDIDGGHLVLPEYRVAVAFPKPTLMIFEGQNIVHGVSPINKRSSLAYRYSVVYYAMKSLLNCGTVDEELERIRSLRIDREARRAATAPEKDENA